MAITQVHRFLSLGTPLGDDKLVVSRVVGEERLGRMFEYRVDAISEDHEVAFDDIVGKNVTVRLELEEGNTRYFNGYVTQFSQVPQGAHLASYQLTVSPWLWMLTRASDCRIFQEMSIPDILEEIFKEFAVGDYELKLSGSYAPLEYCVQYRETYFNFVSRLMEQVGIYYYFEHTNGQHVMHLTDARSGHSPFPGYDEILFRPPGRAAVLVEHVSSWQVGKGVRSGKATLKDFDFKKPAKDLTKSSEIARSHANATYEIYDYPGEYVEPGDGDALAKIRIEELQAQHEVASGQSDARGIASGCVFSLADHPRGDQNREYLVVSTRMLMDSDLENQSGSAFECDFEVIDSRNAFRTLRTTPKPIVQGPQTALVVGPSGEEIHTDKYGRVKVQFHWDRRSIADENSSCWIRVAQLWAGKKWGAMYIPRIGHEVIVEFLEGDPDRPIITGRVYNGANMPPYALPGEKTKSTIKSNSSKGGGGFNEIRLEDKKGKEQVFIHAQRNMDTRVRNDSLARIYGNRHQIIGWEKDGNKGGDQREMIYMDKEITVHRNQIEHIGGDMKLLVGGIDGDGNQDIVIQKDKKELIEGESHLHVVKDENTLIDMTRSLEVGKDNQVKVGANHALDAGKEIHLKGGMKVIIEAGMQVSLKASGSFVDIGPGGVSISGAQVKINSGGSAGSGSGSSPTAPTDAEEADPTTPNLADNAKPGGPEKVKAPKPPKKPKADKESSDVTDYVAPPPLPPGASGGDAAGGDSSSGNDSSGSEQSGSDTERAAAPPAVVEQDSQAEKCILKKLDYKCQHGRAANPQLELWVVPAEAGETLSMTPTVEKGGPSCIKYTLSNKRTGKTKTYSGSKIKIPGWHVGNKGDSVLRRLVRGPRLFWETEPIPYELVAEGCNGKLYGSVLSYPADKFEFSLATEDWVEKLRKYTTPLADQLGKWTGKKYDFTKPQMIKLGGPFYLNIHQPEIKLAVDAQWKESDKKHAEYWKAYCACGVHLGVSPLFGVGIRVDIGYTACAAFGPGLAIAYDHIATRLNEGKAPFYAELSGSISGEMNWEKRATDHSSLGGKLEGKLQFTIGLECQIEGRIVALSASCSAQTAIVLVAEGSFGGGQALILEGKAGWKGVTATVKIRLKTGKWLKWFGRKGVNTDLEKEFQLLDGGSKTLGRIQILPED